MASLSRVLRSIPRPSAKSAWLYVGGFCCLALTALMNRHAGVSQGATEEGRQLLGAAAIVIDIVGIVVFGSVAGNLFASPGKVKKVLGSMVLLVTIGCALFSITSIMSFVASEWLSVAESRKAVIEAAKQKQAADIQASKDRRDGQERLATSALGMMQAQLKDANRKEKRILSEKFSKGTSEMIDALGKEQAAKPAEHASAEIAMRPDGGAEVASWMLNVTERTWQVTRIAAVAVLLIVLKLFAFPLGGYYYNQRRETVMTLLPLSAETARSAPLTLEAEKPMLALPPPVEESKPIATVPAPSALPEPAAEWRPLLAELDYFTARKGALRKPIDRKVLGYHWLTWLYAYGRVGTFTSEQVERMFEEFLLASWREAGTGVNIAKGKLHASALKLDKGAITRDKKSNWTITLKSPKRMRELLVKRAILRPTPAVAAQPDTKTTTAAQNSGEATRGTVVPFPTSPEAAASGDVSLAAAPANENTKPRSPVRGLAELTRQVPDLDAQRHWSRMEKTAWKARRSSLRPQHMHRFSRARAA